MATLAELQTRLSEAEAARHALATGERVESAGRSGRMMKLAAMNLDQLDRYIQTLERDIAKAEAQAAGKSLRRPIGLAWKN